MNTLIVAAHPDDEVIGVGGTIARHVAAGDVVSLLVMTEVWEPRWSKGERKVRAGEVEAAARVLGIREVRFAGFPTVKLNTVAAVELSGVVEKAVKDFAAEVVYLPPADDVNRDHAEVFGAGLVATRPLPDSTVRKVLAYEIGTTTRWSAPEAGRIQPNVFVDITDFMEKKLAAMSCYRSELRQPPHPRSIEGLKVVARERGLSVGVEYAEAFEMIRLVER